MVFVLDVPAIDLATRYDAVDLVRVSGVARSSLAASPISPSMLVDD